MKNYYENNRLNEKQTNMTGESITSQQTSSKCQKSKTERRFQLDTEQGKSIRNS